jgi:hypothetical protein
MDLQEKRSLTIEDIEGKIVKEEYAFYGNKLTVCVLTLKNGFILSETAGCVDPANFDEEIGKRIARQNAINKIWELEGYLLQERLFG